MINHSGIGVYIRNLLSRFSEFSYKISILISPRAAGEYPFLKSFDHIYTSVPIYSIQEQLQLPFLIPESDLFWSMHYNIPIGPIRARKRIVTIHDVNHLVFNSFLSLAQILYAKIMLYQAAHRSEHIFTISHFSEREIGNLLKVSTNKITPIHLGVDRSHFFPSKNQEMLDRVRRRYNLPEKFILFVGNLTPHKNIHGLLLAWEKLQKEGQDWKLVMVGKESKFNDWNHLSKKGVIFLGQVDYNDLPFIYENAYASILPSFYEGFGLTPLESISCGCPIIVSNTASLPEIFGENCVYIDPYNPDDIAKGLRKLMLDRSLHEKLKISGLEKALDFDWDATANNHKEVIDNLIQ